MIQLPIHDPVLIFSIVMLIVLIAPLLAEKLKLPGIIGLLFFGVLFGPHLFGILERDKTIELLGTIGLLYIMFQAGLEINLGEVKKNKHHSLIFGFSTFLIPLFLGILGGYFILNMNLMASILLASMFSSHTLLTFPIASKMGLAKNRAVTATIGGTIITDTFAFLILAVVVGANHGELNLFFWTKLIGLMISYSFVILFFLPKISGWFFRHFSSESGIEEYVFVITVLFISAYCSHLAGFEPIIGAFLAGLTLNPLIPEKSILMNRIQFVGNSLFIPFFLISVGMLINPGVFLSGFETLKISLVMIIIAILSKWIAAHFFGRIVHFKKEEKNLIFGLSVNQAAATLAAVLIGFQVGIFSETVLTGTIMMIVATCFLGAVLTVKYSKELVMKGKESFDLPSGKTLDRILIPLKNPHNLNHLMDLAFFLHPKNSHQPLYPLNVVIEGSDSEEEMIAGESLLTKAVSRSNSVSKETIPLIRIDISVAGAILKSVKEQRISKVILGWNESSDFQTNLFNTILDQFIKKSSEMVFIARIFHPISLAKKIFLIIPSFMTKQSGFQDSLGVLIHFSLSITAKIIFITDDKTLEEIKNLVEKKHSGFPFEWILVKNWKNVFDMLKNQVEKEDLLIQMLARQGELAWKFHYYRMAYKLKQNFPVHNIMAVYPYCNLEYLIEEKNREEKDSLLKTASILDTLPEKNFFLHFPENRVEALLSQISQRDFPSVYEEIYSQLTAILNEYPAELTDEIVLIHIHTYHVSEYQVYLASHKESFVLESLSARPKIIFILFSPKEKSSESHLQMLSEIAKLSMQKELLGKLLQSSNYLEWLENKNRG